MAKQSKLIPAGTAPGMLPDGTISIGTPDEMRPKLELWKRQQAALDRGEDPTLLDEDDDVSDLVEYPDDLLK